jgi:hypothetical protein
VLWVFVGVEHGTTVGTLTFYIVPTVLPAALVVGGGQATKWVQFLLEFSSLILLASILLTSCTGMKVCSNPEVLNIFKKLRTALPFLM